MFDSNTSTSTANASVTDTDHNNVGLIFTNMFIFILSVLTIGGNALTIAVFSKDASLRNNPQSNRHIMSLAVADLGVGLFPLPLMIIINIVDYWPFGIYFCMIKSIVEGTLLIVTIFTIAFISFDRYLLVHKEYPNYLKSQTRLRVNLQIAFTWTCSVVIMVTNEILYFYKVGFGVIDNLYCNFHTNPDTLLTIILLVFLLFIPMSAIAYFNTSTFLKIRKRILQRRKIGVDQTHNVKNTSTVHEQPLGLSHGEANTSKDANYANFSETNRDRTQNSQTRTRTRLDVPSPHAGNSQSKDASFKRRYIRPAVMMGVLLSTFLICWAPLGLTGVLKNFIVVFEDPRDWKWIQLCMYMDSVFNPLLYAIINKKIRIAMIKCLKRN
ncbi:probable G-protein coupled receptor No18 [Anneissia japonica]|uniref:probable G-protein coupled receptor No18 n=1 Tax=Anneissia japonica TaxID=1529436 RepID=UPI00142551CE|nr:probable G-protein coupled receptor No18 [Anneissia japonica]XP_033108101.1 probable G-protein coupled receptor No18 [Anneissia japonica]